jgi:hypothetical protein
MWRMQGVAIHPASVTAGPLRGSLARLTTRWKMLRGGPAHTHLTRHTGHMDLLYLPLGRLLIRL